MKRDADFRKRFLLDSSETGRFIVKSLVSNKEYFIEAIGRQHSNWGDLNPATGKVEGSYGEKFKGSIVEKDSMITSANGFDDVASLENWNDLLSEIEKRDAANHAVG